MRMIAGYNRISLSTKSGSFHKSDLRFAGWNFSTQVFSIDETPAPGAVFRSSNYRVDPSHALGMRREGEGMSDVTGKKVFSVCATCSVRCPVEVDVENGAVKHIWGNPHLMGGRSLCPRGAAQKATQADTERVRYPLIRDGERGSGKWRRASWDEALDYVAKVWKLPFRNMAGRVSFLATGAALLMICIKHSSRRSGPQIISISTQPVPTVSTTPTTGWPGRDETR